MKKTIPYIILFVVAICVIFLLFLPRDSNDRRDFDHRVTLRKKDKIPYGTFVAFEGLHHLFPGASVSSNKKAPSYWDSLSSYETGQALIVVSHRFFADEYEMKSLLKFVENGNDVFVSAMVVSEDVKKMLRCNVSYFDLSEIFSSETNMSDTLSIFLSNPPFSRSYNYSYPGQRFDSHFFKIDSTISTVLGNGRGGNANFLHLRAGKGNFYLHLAPLAFSNYFLLHRNNLQYYENVLSVIGPSVRKVVWDEYYLNKRYFYEEREDRKRSGWFNTFMKYSSLRWALLTAILILLAFVLFEMGRKQRYIPVVAKPRNDSLEFVKTIGRLYFEKGDHSNLARKMGSYFLEHVRNKYKIPTGSLNEEFIQKLQFKSGIAAAELQPIVTFIADLEGGNSVTNKQLADFHRQLESFYQKA